MLLDKFVRVLYDLHSDKRAMAGSAPSIEETISRVESELKTTEEKIIALEPERKLLVANGGDLTEIMGELNALNDKKKVLETELKELKQVQATASQKSSDAFEPVPNKPPADAAGDSGSDKSSDEQKPTQINVTTGAQPVAQPSTGSTAKPGGARMPMGMLKPKNNKSNNSKTGKLIAGAVMVAIVILLLWYSPEKTLLIPVGVGVALIAMSLFAPDKMKLSTAIPLTLVFGFGWFVHMVNPGDYMALAPIACVAGAILVLAYAPDNVKPFVLIGLIIIFVLTLVYSGATILHSFKSGEASAVIGESAEKTAEGSTVLKERLTKFWDRTVKGIEAPEEQFEGEKEQTTQYKVGIEFDAADYNRFSEEIEEDEINYYEIRTKLIGYDPKTPLSLKVACSVKSTDAARGWKDNRVGGEIDRYPGATQKVTPQSFSEQPGKQFKQEIVCYPRTSQYKQDTDNPTGMFDSSEGNEMSCGKHQITITAEASGVRTDARLENYIMHEEAMYQEMRTVGYFDEQNPDSNKVMKELHPELDSYKSVSEDAPMMVAMHTEENLVIGVNEETPLVLKVALENTQDGWLRKINSLMVLLPDEVEPIDEFCTSWDFDGEFLVPTDDLLSTLSFDDIGKGERKTLPSCQLRIKDPTQYVFPEYIIFLASFDYDYVIQDKHDIQIRNETGGTKCPEPIDTSTPSSTTSSTGTSSPTEGSDGFTKTADAETWLGLIADACKGKSPGDICASPNERCLGYDGIAGFFLSTALDMTMDLDASMLCLSECEYKAFEETGGVTDDYSCEAPLSCEPGSVLPGVSCKSSFASDATSMNTRVCCILDD